jgi:uncharacterized protein YdhG (YjbR/CyaY superfamily)
METKEQFKTIDGYIKTFPEDIQSILEKMRRTIRRAAPEAVEAISYQIPTFKLNGNLVHFAAFKKHIGFYPIFRQNISRRLGKISKIMRLFPADQVTP